MLNIYISHAPSYVGGYTLESFLGWKIYSGYSKKEALRMYKKEKGLRYVRNINIIDETKGVK